MARIISFCILAIFIAFAQAASAEISNSDQARLNCAKGVAPDISIVKKDDRLKLVYAATVAALDNQRDYAAPSPISLVDICFWSRAHRSMSDRA